MLKPTFLELIPIGQILLCVTTHLKNSKTQQTGKETNQKSVSESPEWTGCQQ